MPAAKATGKRGDPMPASEHASLRAYLATRGLTGPQVTAAVGAGPNGRTREQVEQGLTSWLSARPKG